MQFFDGSLLGLRPRKIEEDLSSSPGQRLLEAIVNNRHPEVQTLLENGADPNTPLGIINSECEKEEFSDKIASIDRAFLWKKLFGEAPTPLHLSVINVYHRSDRRRELKGALEILSLLLKHGGDISITSNNIFLRKYPIETNPLDLALGVQRMTLWLHLEKPEAAMIQAVDLIREHYDSKKPIVRSNKVPFELVSLPHLDVVKGILFVNVGPDVCIVSSDGTRQSMNGMEGMEETFTKKKITVGKLES